MPANVATRYVGDDWRGRLAFAFTYQDATGAPIDVTGWTPSGQIWSGPDAVPVRLTVANGRAALTDPANGRFELSLEAAATAALPVDQPGTVVPPTRLQARIADGSGNVGTLDLVPILVLDPRTATP